MSSLMLLNADGTPAGSGAFGSTAILENETVRVDLALATFVGSGEAGSTVRVAIPVEFKEEAVHSRPYNIELFAVDDEGGEQGPDLLGTWRVIDPAIYLPVISDSD